MPTKPEELLLETRNITKRFGKVLANDNISIKLYAGEILSLLGENGAGKSTLMNVLYGLYRPGSGDILLDGQVVEFPSPKDAIDRGLGMVHQHFMLIDTLSVTENIILGTEPGRMGVIDHRTARAEVAQISQQYGLAIDPDARIETLSVGVQQRVEILKALYRRARILILDEPTAVLTPQEVDHLFGVIRELCRQGVSIILITHKLEEVKAISDRVYVLRRGSLVGERKTNAVTTQELANLMVGRDVVLTVEKEEKEAGPEPVFELHEVTVRGDKGVDQIRGVSFGVHPGEIVGVAGVDGNGQSELAEAIMGLRQVSAGELRYAGRDIAGETTKDRLRHGIGHVPADRHRFGLVMPMTVAENVVMGFHDRRPFARGLSLDLAEIDRHAKELVERFDVRTTGVDVAAQNLSGGNQQKVILAREFSRDPRFLLVSQPTRGLDVGAIEYIHSQILEMRDRGVAILLISLELEEIFSLADRILVLYEGRIVKEFPGGTADEAEVGFAMTGGRPEEAS